MPMNMPVEMFLQQLTLLQQQLGGDGGGGGGGARAFGQVRRVVTCTSPVAISLPVCGSSGSCLPVHLRGAGKEAEIRGSPAPMYSMVPWTSAV
jgi:hypothetical protein